MRSRMVRGQTADTAVGATGDGQASAKSRLLAAAADCFYNHGVNGTGIDTITAAAGVAKMSLYNNFGSKDQLVLAYLQARHEEWLALYRRRVETVTDGRQGVAAVFDAYIDHAEMAYQHGFRGCGLLNAAAELPAGAPGRELVRRHKEEVESLLAGHLAQLVPEAQRRPLAEQLSFLLEGAMVRAGLAGDPELLRHARDLGLQIVDAAASSSSR